MNKTVLIVVAVFVGLLLFIGIVAAGISSYNSKITGALSDGSKRLTLDELQKITDIRAYYIGKNSAFEGLTSLYRFYDAGDKLWLDTYFADANAITVAELSMVTATTANPPPRKGSGDVVITWGVDQKGYICEGIVKYKTCLFWIDKDGPGWETLYSNWDEQKTVEFVNSLLSTN